MSLELKVSSLIFHFVFFYDVIQQDNHNIRGLQGSL